ncbi:MAG: hypothetical protein CVV24_00285 [Ignavibacteriae bacterium HGW-Ignavibacteriae-3]|nr:MAG: hypothetical protein CVV24_00285 [Ignavibacteriae bacterium HGW-Ignavibacteriae-3]
MTSLFVWLSVPMFAQQGNIQGALDYTSIVKVTGTAEGVNSVSYTNPYTNQSTSHFAGTFNGTLNSVTKKFYCIDVQHSLAYNEDYWDESSTPSQITYILNNYFPYKTSYTGKLSDNGKEAAAVQFAIWHFADGVNANSISNNIDVKNRALAIIANAAANHTNTIPLQSLIFVPTAQTLPQGTAATFDVYALDFNGNPISGLPITLTTNLGTLNISGGTTNSSGRVGPVTLSYTGIGTATIKAQAAVEISQGTRYVHKAKPGEKQKLVLATPAHDTKQVNVTVTWYTPGNPGSCDTKGFTTYTQGGWGSPSNSTPGKIRDLYFSTVFPSGLTIGGGYKLTLSTASDVMNYLPDGGTAAAYTQNYNNPTSSINVLSGQLTALKLNVKYSAAGKIGSNTVKLGDLTIAIGPFTGMTVTSFLAYAEAAIGGGPLNGKTFSQINDAATAINENFDNGTTDKGFLACEEIICKNNIGSYVYRDLNTNGVMDSGEPGIAGAVVELYSGTTLVSTKTTDVNGMYSFSNLSNAPYTVKLASSNFASGGVLYSSTQTKWYTKNSTSVNTTLNCNDNLSINFGYYKTCVNITKTSDKSSYNKGETVTYSFLVENCGDIQLHGGVDIFDAMLNPTGNNLIEHINILNPRTSTTFTKTYVTSDKDCGQLVNRARAVGHPVDGSVSVTDESTWTVNIICQDKSDIKVEKSVNNANPQCDQNVTFTIKATNLGPNTANGVQVTDLLPTGLIYVSNSPSQGSYNSTTGIWNIGTLANNAFATLTITVKVDCGQVNNAVFDLGIAKDYNLFVIEDVLQPSSDTQGRVAVGRNAQFSNYSIGDQLPSGSGDVLIVGNDLTFTSGAIYNGNVVYGHATNLPLSLVSITGGTLRKDSPINFAAAKTYLENLSTTLAGYATTGTTTLQWGGIILAGTDPYLNVFSVSGADLSSANNLTINVPNGSVVLINTSGTTLSWTGGLTVNGTATTNVLFNFPQATSLTIQGIDITGSVLAPFAAVNFASGVINGQMICKSLTGMGQFNAVFFGGQIPVDKQITNIASVSASSTQDPNPANNSSSATVSVTGTSGNNGTGNNGGGTTGGSWSNVCSFAPGEIIYTILYDGGDIYAGTWGGKIYKSTDNGKSWLVANNGMNVSFIWSLIKFNGTVYAATEKGVYTYNGTTAAGLAGKDVHALATDGTTLYAGTWGYGVFKSSDGTSWTEMNTASLKGFTAVQSLAVKTGQLFVGTAGGGLFSSDGMNFTKLSCGYSVIWSLAAKADAIYAGTYGDGLYRSLDNGMSFTKVASLNVSFVYSISVDHTGKIYVSSITNGVYVSSDNGETWSSLGMNGSGISSMMVNGNSSDVYVGTKEGKLFKIVSANGTTNVTENDAVPTEFNLDQNFPNPFNPSTTIQFAVPEAGVYSLKVYNILGEEIAELISGQLVSGVHKVNFDAGRLASGMYIYRLSGSKVNITKKMILMK